MTSTVAIAGRTAIYPSGLQSALTLKNVGAETVYLDSKANVNMGGFPLGVNSSIVWDANRPLYAYADNGQLLVSENSGNLFDAQAVAAEIIAGGLAGDIAAQIAINGVPQIAKRIDLLNWSGIPNPDGGPSAFIDVTPYSTLIVQIHTTQSAWAEFILSGLNIMYLSAYGGGNAGSSGYTTYYIPVEGEASLFFAASVLGTRSASVNIYGSTLNVPTLRCVTRYDAVTVPVGTIDYYPAYSTQSFLMKLSGQDTTLRQMPISIRSGPCSVTLDTIGNNADPSLILIRDTYTGADILPRISVVSGVEQTLEWQIPPRPVTLVWDCGTSITGLSIAFNYKE